jgi:hypothetical protein
MAVFTATVSSTMLNWLTGNTTPAAVATRYITVFNGDPQGAGSEVISTLTGSANRIAMTAAVPTTATNTVSSNADIVFTTSAVGSSLVTHVAVYSAITAGTLYASAAVTASKTPAIGDGLRILSGNLTFTIN